MMYKIIKIFYYIVRLISYTEGDDFCVAYMMHVNGDKDDNKLIMCIKLY